MKKLVVHQVCNITSFAKFKQCIADNTDTAITFIAWNEPHLYILDCTSVAEIHDVLALIKHNRNTVNVILGADPLEFFKRQEPKDYTEAMIELYSNIQYEVSYLCFVHDACPAFLFDRHTQLPYDYCNITMKTTCLNRVPRPHRVKLVDQLYHRGLFDNNIVSWSMLLGNNASSYGFEHWEEYLKTYNEGPSNVQRDFALHSEPLEYNNTLVDLVSESCVDTVFITEKVIRPIFLEKPFVVLGAPGIHSALADLGFELYTEIFDYSFDSYSNEDERIDSIITQIEQIDSTQLQQLREQVSEKAHRNMQHLFTLMFDLSNYPDELISHQQVYSGIQAGYETAQEHPYYSQYLPDKPNFDIFIEKNDN